MENYLSDAFVTGLTVTGRYVTSAFQSDPEELRKDERLNGGKIDDDIASIEGKIYRNFRAIDMGCYITEKALENLALEKESIQIDLTEMRQRMCVDHSGKSNYLRMLIQLLGKLNSLAKEIKKIHKFRSVNLNKRLIATSDEARKRSQSPTKLILQKTNNSQNDEKKKSPMEGIITRYEEALKSQLEYRQMSATCSNLDLKIKQNVRQFNLKKVKKVKILNKKVDEVYQLQKEKQNRHYEELMSKKAIVPKSASPMNMLAPNNNIHNINRSHQSFRQTVQNKKQLLEQELHQKLNKIMIKHQSKCLLISSSTQSKVPAEVSKRIKDAQERKQILEEHLFKSKLQKVIEKEERIRKIVQSPNHGWRNSTKTEINTETQDQVIAKPIAKMSYTMKELPNRNNLLQTLTDSQSRVSSRKETILKQMSDDIRIKLQERFQRQIKRHQENIHSYNGRMEEIQNRMIETKRINRTLNSNSQRHKENVIKEKFQTAIDRYRCDEKISQLKSLTIQDLEKRVKMGKQAALLDLHL